MRNVLIFEILRLNYFPLSSGLARSALLLVKIQPAEMFSDAGEKVQALSRGEERELPQSVGGGGGGGVRPGVSLPQGHLAGLHTRLLFTLHLERERESESVIRVKVVFLTFCANFGDLK